MKKIITVSIVDDEADLREHIADYLAAAGNICCKSAYASAEEALEHLPQDKPDVILMDIKMRGISGFGALKALREDPVTAHIPVIALSANAIPRDIEQGLEAGFFRYLTKPIKVNEFMDTLDVTLKFAKAQSARTNKDEET